MLWMILSLCGAFFQALGSAVSKRTLRIKDYKNFVGFVSYTFAGIIFFAINFISSGIFWVGGLSLRFWLIIFSFSLINALGAWFLYRALEFSELNYIMPFMTFTSLTLIIPPIFMLGEIPSLGSISGMILIVSGAILINHKKEKSTPDEIVEQSLNRRGLKYFLVTAICFTILPTHAKMMVQESSVLFASGLSQIFTGFSFLIFIVIQKQWNEFRALSWSRNRSFFIGMIAIGIIYVCENGSINLALSMAPVAQVFAIKRLMPFFAFLIGFFYFKERDALPKKMIATTLMVVGAIATILF